jgi:hypothetical protein
VLIACVAVAACQLAPAANAEPAFRVKRLCGPPRAGAAACLAMRLVPSSLTPSDLRAQARSQAREEAGGGQPAVAVKTPYAGYQTPQRLHDAYTLPTETADSSQQTVAVVDAFDDPTAEADLAVYDKQFALPECTSANGCFRKIDEEGKAKPLPHKEGGWGTEISIDVQMAHAICQSCHVLLVEANSESFKDLGTAVNAAVAAGATEISNSYGGPERENNSAKLSERYFDHPGLVVTASSGDCGYLGEACLFGGGAAEFPAASPDVVAVGGTSLHKQGKLWRSSAWSEGGSGCSVVFAAPAWQSSLAGFSATGCGSGRSVADLSAIGDPRTGVDMYDSTPDGEGDPTGWGVWGGTSVSSPIVAAEFGLAGGAQGVQYPAATLYSHLGDAGDLYDVVSGSNGTCGGASACQAGPGYDGPTGVGSPIGLGAFSTGEAASTLSIASFKPASAKVGRLVTIEGTGFEPSSSVSFGGASASTVEFVSPTKLKAAVPPGAAAGPITVTNASPPGSAASAASFTPR